MDTPQAGSRVLRFPEPQVGVAFDEARIGPPGLPGLPTGALPPSGDSGVALSDLESLLQSVTHRLRSTVGAASTHGLRPLQTPAETEAAVFGVRACVLECAQAIDQLRRRK